MNEWMNEWMNERTSERTNERTNEWTNEWMTIWKNEYMRAIMNARVNERTYACMNECMHACMNACMSQCVSEWMKEGRNEWMNACMSQCMSESVDAVQWCARWSRRPGAASWSPFTSSRSALEPLVPAWTSLDTHYVMFHLCATAADLLHLCVVWMLAAQHYLLISSVLPWHMTVLKCTGSWCSCYARALTYRPACFAAICSVRPSELFLPTQLACGRFDRQRNAVQQSCLLTSLPCVFLYVLHVISDKPLHVSFWSAPAFVFWQALHVLLQYLVLYGLVESAVGAVAFFAAHTNLTNAQVSSCTLVLCQLPSCVHAISGPFTLLPQMMHAVLRCCCQSMCLCVLVLVLILGCCHWQALTPAAW